LEYAWGLFLSERTYKGQVFLPDEGFVKKSLKRLIFIEASMPKAIVTGTTLNSKMRGIEIFFGSEHFIKI